MSTVASRPVYLTREGTHFRLAFSYDEGLVQAVKRLPYASFDKETRSWSTLVCSQSVEALRRFFYDGLCDCAPDSLLVNGEVPVAAPPATLRAGSRNRPYFVHVALRDDHMFQRLRSVPGAVWDRSAKAMGFPPQAAAALAEMVDRGLLDDPDRLLDAADVTVCFDGRVGRFLVRGDSRAQLAFDKWFPSRDVVSEWRDREISVGFSDGFAEQMYRGELARGSGTRVQPDGLLLDLFGFQAEALAVAVERDGFSVFAEMGLGKTASGVAYGFEFVTNRGVAARTVCVVPASVRTHWRDEIVRFTGQSDVVVVDGTPKQRHAQYVEAATARWLVLPFSETLTSDSKHILPLVSGCVLVADEAHRLRNPKSKRTKVMRRYASRAARRLALTGTPVDNNPGEIHSILSGFANPGSFGSGFDWLSRYSFPGQFGGFEGARNLGELRDRAAPFLVRQTKALVAEHLPPLRVQHLQLDPPPAYAAALARAHREAAEEIRGKAMLSKSATSGGPAGGNVLDGYEMDEVAAGAEMTAVGMLRSLCSSPRLLEMSDTVAAQAMRDAGLLPDADGPKVDWVRDLCREMDQAGNRVVVFSFSKRMVSLLADRLTADGVSYVTFTGDTSRKDRDAAIAAFTTPDRDVDPDVPDDAGFRGPTVFLATDAGGEGLNLGACCSTLVNVDLPWTPGALAQRSARIHRVDGTADRYLVLNLTLAGTLESGVLRLLERKAGLSAAVLGDDTSMSAVSGRGSGSSSGNVFAEALAGFVDS